MEIHSADAGEYSHSDSNDSRSNELHVINEELGVSNEELSHAGEELLIPNS